MFRSFPAPDQTSVPENSLDLGDQSILPAAPCLASHREAVKEACSACRIFVVDTFWRVVVHYADSPVTLAASEAAGEAPLPFPPPTESAIGQYLKMRRAVRPTAGQEVVYSRPGTPEVRGVI